MILFVIRGLERSLLISSIFFNILESNLCYLEMYFLDLPLEYRVLLGTSSINLLTSFVCLLLSYLFISYKI